MAGPDAKLVLRIKARDKERQTDNVVKMRVGEKEISVEGCFFEESVAKIAKPGSGIKDQ